MIAAICRVRDEADIIGYTTEHMLQECDLVIVSDNGSVDGTRDILEDLGKKYSHLTIVDDPDHRHWQGARTTELMHQAGRMGAEWVIPYDADEWWPVVTPEDADVVLMRSHVFLPDPSDDLTEENPLLRMTHRLLPYEPFPKVAFRYHWTAAIREGNHDVKHPGLRRVQVEGMRHYQYRSLEQVKRKVRQGTKALEATELSPSTGGHWRQLASLDDDQMSQWWTEYLNQPKIKTTPLGL